jgi:hypothetical protein
MSFTRAQVARALGISRTAIDNLIQRGHFGTDLYPAPAEKYGWSVQDVVRLATAIELGNGLGRSLASVFADHAHLAKPPGAFLVAYEVPVNRAAAGRPGGLRGWTCEQVTRREMPAFLESGGAETFVIVDLDAVVKRVANELAKMGADD